MQKFPARARMGRFTDKCKYRQVSLYAHISILNDLLNSFYELEANAYKWIISGKSFHSNIYQNHHFSGESN
ncbi:hypothetical protein MSHOH_3937 [Methanosarcina horonobensis HB-1 = JCM 15518]|uniref:Uncharacterized protein n=1 Tax=Methanosarcina horonobensis HB-1 = JCM 15518 TaxID=1434110 RepID=A0A0E3WV50_9EURY|nr:hypothetical protein [Methanosarcina horonobensis]AKB80420.1 hypothetical protein MSHOH_3937 [Methanosarcina horonobensis HB-1 = JCM 15518]